LWRASPDKRPFAAVFGLLPTLAWILLRLHDRFSAFSI